MAVADRPLAGLGYAPAADERAFVRLSGSDASESRAVVAEEVPVALVYNGRSHVVVMATPSDLEDLAIGFSLTEGIIDSIDDVQRLDVVRASQGVELQLEIPPARADALVARTLAARTGCGLCGVETIADAMRLPAPVGRMLRVTPAALWRAASELDHQQTLNNATNAVHAAGWALQEGALVLVREDVGRHNALDKLLGALARAGRSASDGFVIVTSRASYEMVQKAASRGVELLAAISRPTGLAIRFADSAGVTLVGLLRASTGNVYCGRERIHPLASGDDSSWA
jgi:FdhD protein